MDWCRGNGALVAGEEHPLEEKHEAHGEEEKGMRILKNLWRHPRDNGRGMHRKKKSNKTENKTRISKHETSGLHLQYWNVADTDIVSRQNLN